MYTQIDVLFPGDKRTLMRALIYALIDLGQITEIKCAWTECVLPDQPLEPAGTRRACATLDHIKARTNGGTDHWTNLQLMHHTCNMRKSHDFTESHRRKVSDSVKKRWQDPTYREKIIEKTTAGNRTEAARAKRSASMKAHWADPERRAKHAKALQDAITPEVMARRNESVKKAWARRKEQEI
jgi:hypothetical protein